jgi:hypothetical protein
MPRSAARPCLRVSSWYTCTYVRVVNVYYVRTRVWSVSAAAAGSRHLVQTPPVKHEVTWSAVESEESVSMRKGIEHGCCKEH